MNTINDIRITTEFLKTIQFNSYSLHSENMLCVMLTDLRAEVRVKAVVIILTCRDTSEVGVRIFEKLILNFTATEYYNLISITWLEPYFILLTKNIKISF